MPERWFSDGLSGSPQFQSLLDRVSRLEQRLQPVSNMASTARRREYRIGAAQLGLLVGAGSTATVTVKWSAPMPSEDYSVDVAVAALLGLPVTNIQKSGQTVSQCTVSFTVPALLTLGTAVTVLAVSAPTLTQGGS